MQDSFSPGDTERSLAPAAGRFGLDQPIAPRAAGWLSGCPSLEEFEGRFSLAGDPRCRASGFVPAH